MIVDIGRAGLTKTHQFNFLETTKCVYCGGEARIGFVAHEGLTKDVFEGPLVSSLHSNEGRGGYWLHDFCAVAVYFCQECLEITALYNQG